MQRIVLPDGAALACDIHDFTDPWLSSEPLIFVHGFSKNRKFWYEWIPNFARDYRVHNVDMRGHGDSSPVDPDSRFSLTPFARDLVDLLDALDIQAAHFIMAEFATAVAIELAAEFPARVKSLVLPGFGYNWRAGAASPKAWAELLRKEGTAAWARETSQYRLPADTDPALREWYIAQQSRMPASLLIRMFEFATTLDQTERLPLVKAPSLVLYGSLAQQATADSMALAEKLMPNAKFMRLEGMPFNVMTASPTVCIESAKAFLRSLKTENPAS
jgi:pimeloyl-ACP methyl ester carboxylesterase